MASDTAPQSEALIRFADLTFAILGLAVSSPVILMCAIAIRATSPGGAFFAQERVGKDQKTFVCYKLRTMRQGTRSAGSHEIEASAVTSLGHFLRRTKLDELPQLWNVLKGEMSLVGPRPCLPSQGVLIEERARRGVFSLTPGITGPAQVQGIDMSDPLRLAKLDITWASERSLKRYLAYVLMTVAGRGRGDRVQGATLRP